MNIAPAPEYARLAAVFDTHGEKLERPVDIEPTLKRGLAEMEKGKAAVLDVIL